MEDEETSILAQQVSCNGDHTILRIVYSGDASIEELGNNKDRQEVCDSTHLLHTRSS